MLTDQQIVDIFKTKLKESADLKGIELNYGLSEEDVIFSLGYELSDSDNLNGIRYLVNSITSNAKDNNAVLVNVHTLEVGYEGTMRFLDVSYDLLNDKGVCINSRLQRV